jgi:hypothetical protein
VHKQKGIDHGRLTTVWIAGSNPGKSMGTGNTSCHTLGLSANGQFRRNTRHPKLRKHKFAIDMTNSDGEVIDEVKANDKVALLSYDFDIIFCCHQEASVCCRVPINSSPCVRDG